MKNGLANKAVLSRRRLFAISAHVSAAALFVGLAPSCSRPSQDKILWPGMDDDVVLTKLLAAYSGLGSKPVKENDLVLEGALDTVKVMLSGIEMAFPGLYKDLCLALSVLEAAPLVSGYWDWFSNLTSKEQEELLNSWIESPVKFQVEIAYGLKPLFIYAVYEQPSIKARLGYDSPWVPRERYASYRSSYETD